MLVIICVSLAGSSQCLILPCAKVRKSGKSEISVVHNVAYGTGLHDQNTGTHAEDTYDYPTMDQLNVEPFDTKANESYATNMIESVSKMTCDPSIETGGNEAYATNIETRGNEAYATNIETGENEAYDTIT